MKSAKKIGNSWKLPHLKKRRKHVGQLFDSPRNAHVKAMGKDQGCAMASKNWSQQLHGARNAINSRRACTWIYSQCDCLQQGDDLDHSVGHEPNHLHQWHYCTN
jgi:hypothetical protein